MIAQVVTQVDRVRVTPDMYLELEEDAVDRHEFLDGEIVAMAGGTPEHNEIALNGVGRTRFMGWISGCGFRNDGFLRTRM
jgi:Uma2 family endonuclease